MIYPIWTIAIELRRLCHIVDMVVLLYLLHYIGIVITWWLTTFKAVALTYPRYSNTASICRSPVRDGGKTPWQLRLITCVKVREQWFSDCNMSSNVLELLQLPKEYFVHPAIWSCRTSPHITWLPAAPPLPTNSTTSAPAAAAPRNCVQPRPLPQRPACQYHVQRAHGYGRSLGSLGIDLGSENQEIPDD